MMIVPLIKLGLMFFAGREVLQLLGDADDPEETKGAGGGDAADDDGAARSEAEVEVEVVREEDATTRSEVDALGGSVAVAATALASSLLGVKFAAARILTYPLLFGNMWPTARASYRSFRERGKVDFATLVTVGTALELLLGYVSLSALGWLIFSLGCALQSRSRRATEADVRRIFHQIGETAWVLRGDVEIEIAIEAIDESDRVVVHAGESIPVDGRIESGVIAVDQRALTGESRLQELGVGDEVFAATLVLSGHAVIAPLHTGAATVAARVEALLAETESFEQSIRGEAEKEAERSLRPTAAMMAFGLVTQGPRGLVSGYYTNCTELAWLGSPLSMVNTIQEAARSSIVIKDGRSLSLLNDIDTVVFDKTGTLTLNSFVVAEVRGYGGADRALILRIAAALERHQHHPIAAAILAADQSLAEELAEAEDLTTTIGYGVRGRVDGRDALLGSARYMEAEGVEFPEGAADEVSAESHHTRIVLALDGVCAGIIDLVPELREEALDLLAGLRARGMEILMVTGDDEAPSAALARRLGITRYRARALPEDKHAIICELQRAGHRVCFVGDGINDGVAMRRANVSVSMTGASFVAIESAQVLLKTGSLRELESLFDLAATFASEQRIILQTSRVLSVGSSAALLLFGLTPALATLIYVGGFGLTVVTASLPRLRGALGDGLRADAGDGRPQPRSRSEKVLKGHLEEDKSHA